jgi:flagellar basal-body rod modification protein FlgD
MSTSSASTPAGSLNENSFLQLLTMQMKNQDPLSPQDNTAFVAQLAQFTSLEQMTNVSTTDQSILQTLTTMQSTWQVLMAHQLIGTQVTVNDANGQPVSGSVSSVKMVSGEPQFEVNGSLYPMSSLVEMGSGSIG